MIVDKIQAYLDSEEQTVDEALLARVGELAAWSFRRQFMEREERRGGISMSSCGRCPRQQAYRYHEFESKGREIDARAKMVFFMGDLTEAAVTSLALCAGCDLRHTGKEQSTLKMDLGEGVEATGHPDGVLVDEIGEQYLFECKSMSSFSFRDFEKGEIDWAYQCQIQAYMDALDIRACVYVALNKDAGVLKELVIPFDPDIASDATQRMKQVAESKRGSLPDREFTPDDKGFLPWNCGYCSYWCHCYPQAVFKKAGRSMRLYVGVK